MKYSIESTRIILRQFTLKDAEAYFLMTRDDAIQTYVPHAFLNTLDETIQCIDFYYAHGDCIHDFYLIIEEKETQKTIGALIATQAGKENVFDMAILIDKKYRRKGFMSEALQAFISNLPQGSELIFVVDTRNKASIQTVSKLQNLEKKTLKNQKYMFTVTV